MRLSTFVSIIMTFCLHTQSKADRNWDERQGFVFNLSSSEEFDALHGEIMAEAYANPYISYRGGLSIFLSHETDIHGGIEGGVRCLPPLPVSPFIGAGLFLGRWTYYKSADNDGVDNDDDHVVDESGEQDAVRDYLFAVYPEVGVYLWLNDSTRLTGTLRYYVTTDGRESDRLMYGIGLGFAF